MSGDTATVDRCESPQVSEYRSRLQRTQRSRHSRNHKNGKSTKQTTKSAAAAGEVTHGYHQSVHRTPLVCAPTTLDNSNNHNFLLSTPQRRRSKSEPRNSSPRKKNSMTTPSQQQQQQHIPLAAERFCSQGYPLEQHSQQQKIVAPKLSQSPRTLSKAAFPQGTLNQGALAEQRRKLDGLVRLHAGIALKDNNNNNNHHHHNDSSSNSSSSIAGPHPLFVPSNNKSSSPRGRSKSTGRLQDNNGRSSRRLPILLEPFFLATAPSSSTAATTSSSTEEFPQPLPNHKNTTLQLLPSMYNNTRTGNLDFHAASGTGFLTTRTQPSTVRPNKMVASSTASSSTEEFPQPLPNNIRSHLLPNNNNNNHHRTGNVDFHAASGTGFLTCGQPAVRPSKTTRPPNKNSNNNKRPRKFSNAALIPPPPSTSHNNHNPPAVTVTPMPTGTASSSSKPTAPPPEHPRIIHTRVEHHPSGSSSPSRRDREQQEVPQHRHRSSHSGGGGGGGGGVGRPPRCPTPSEKSPDIPANRKDDTENGNNDEDDDDDEDATPSEFSRFTAQDDGTGCGDPCSSSNLRSGIRAGQGVAERLSNCFVVATPWSMPADDDDDDEESPRRRRSRSSTASSRHKQRPPPPARSMDDHDAYFLSSERSRSRRQRHDECGEVPRSISGSRASDGSVRMKPPQRRHRRTDRFVVHGDDHQDKKIVPESVSHIGRRTSSCDSSSWGPLSPPPPLETVQLLESPRASSDRELIGPPQIILKINRRHDQRSPTSILQDPFDPQTQQHEEEQQNKNKNKLKSAQNNETLLSVSALTYSPDRYTPPRRRPLPPLGAYETTARSRDDDAAKMEVRHPASSNPYDESSTQRRQQLLLGARRTRTFDSKPFDEQSGTEEPPQPLQSLMDSSISSGRHSPSMEKQQQQLRHSATNNDNNDQQQQSRPPLGTSNSLLRDVRLEMFQRGGGEDNNGSENHRAAPPPKSVSFSDVTNNKLDALAGHALDRLQQKELTVLQQKLRDHAAALEQTKRELELSRAETAQRSQLFELASANIFEERMQVEEKLREEILSNEEIKKQMQELRKEVARLGNAIETTEVTTLTTTASSGDGDKTAQAVERLSADLRSLRSEVVDLRAQLVESQASSVAKDEEIDKLRCERDDAQSQLSGLNQKVKQLERESITLRARATLASVQQDKDVTNRYEERIEILQADLEEARRRVNEQAETKKALERELEEVQAVARKFDDLKHHVEQTQRDAEAKVSASDAESRKLQMQLREIKEKLSHTNSEIINQAAAHLKEKSRLQSELEHTRQVAQVLQTKVSNMDQDLAAILEENEKQKIIVDVGRASNKDSAPGVFLGLIRKTLDRSRTPSPSEQKETIES